MNKHFTNFICILTITGMSFLVFALKKITDLGIHADEIKSSGSIAASDTVLVLVALVIVVSCLISIPFVLKRDAPVKGSSLNKDQKNFKNRALLGLIFSAASLLVFYLTPVAVIFGIWALVDSYKDNLEWKNILTYRITIVLAGLLSVINFAIVFTTY